jgi:RimJ/RimL family protein N-acetyltransferase
MDMFVRTQRLFLRPGWTEDAPELAQALGEQSIVRNLARVPWPYGEEHARAWLASPHDPRLPSLLVTLPDEKGRIAGGCGLYADHGKVGIGYWISREDQGRGYATEAAQALLGLARVLGHQRVEAHHFADNPASGRVLRKCGFVPTGRTSPRPSLGRGGVAPAVSYVAEIENESAMRWPVAA